MSERKQVGWIRFVEARGAWRRQSYHFACLKPLCSKWASGGRNWNVYEGDFGIYSASCASCLGKIVEGSTGINLFPVYGTGGPNGFDLTPEDIIAGRITPAPPEAPETQSWSQMSANADVYLEFSTEWSTITYVRRPASTQS